MSEQTMETKILGRRAELNKFLAFAQDNAHKFVTMEYFRPCGRQVKEPSETGYEVGHVDRPALMRAYVRHVFDQRQREMQGAAA
jgi:hypothetical protein